MHAEEEILKEAHNTVQNLIEKKIKAYFEEKLKKKTANPKKLWKTLKQEARFAGEKVALH